MCYFGLLWRHPKKLKPTPHKAAFVPTIHYMIGLAQNKVRHCYSTRQRKARAITLKVTWMTRTHGFKEAKQKHNQTTRDVQYTDLAFCTVPRSPKLA